jgi:predicted CoA-binding protein
VIITVIITVGLRLVVVQMITHRVGLRLVTAHLKGMQHTRVARDIISIATSVCWYQGGSLRESERAGMAANIRMVDQDTCSRPLG